MTRSVVSVVDTLSDKVEELTSTQTSRTGVVVSRVVKALGKGVDPAVLALQMTKNSRKNNPKASCEFTEDDVKSYSKLYHANKTTSLLPKKQVNAMIRVQEEADSAKDFCEEGFCPA